MEGVLANGNWVLAPMGLDKYRTIEWFGDRLDKMDTDKTFGMVEAMDYYHASSPAERQAAIKWWTLCNINQVVPFNIRLTAAHIALLTASTGSADLGTLNSLFRTVEKDSNPNPIKVFLVAKIGFESNVALEWEIRWKNQTHGTFPEKRERRWNEDHSHFENPRLTVYGMDSNLMPSFKVYNGDYSAATYAILGISAMKWTLSPAPPPEPGKMGTRPVLVIGEVE